MDPIVLVPPRWEPVGLSDLKAHLKVDGDDEDVLLWGYLQAAREEAERRTGRALATQTLRVVVDAFEAVSARRDAGAPAGYDPRAAGTIVLPRAPVQSIVQVQWTSSTGAVTTLAGGDYLLAATDPNRSARLFPGAAGWPVGPFAAAEAVRVDYVAGYANADDVPHTIRQWILLHAAKWYEQRLPIAVNGNVTGIPGAEWLVYNWRVPGA